MKRQSLKKTTRVINKRNAGDSWPFLFGIGPSTILKLKHETTAVVYSIVIHNILKKKQ